MKQMVDFRIGFDEERFGPNDDINEVLEFIKKAAIGKRLSVHVIVDEKK